MSDPPESQHRPNRRRFLAALSAAGFGGLAGCGFGGDGDQTTISPITTLPPERTPTEAPTSTETAELPTTTQPTTTDGLVEGRTWRMFVPAPLPAEVQYNPLGSDAFWWDGESMMRVELFGRSLVDLNVYPEAVREWNYETGVLTVDIHENIFWVSGSETERSPVPVTAEDWVEGTGLLRATQIPRIEQLGDHRFRVFLEDPWRLDFALSAGLLGNLQPAFNSTFWRPYLDRIRDASTDTKREEVRDEAAERRVTSPHPVSNLPFRVQSTGTDRWTLTLRDDETPQSRWVSDATFGRVQIVVEESMPAQTDAFENGRLPFAGTRPQGIGFFSVDAHASPPFDESVVDLSPPFAASTLTIPRFSAPASYAMNVARHPTANVHFRRAVAYLLDREAHTTRFMEGDRIITGFPHADDEQRYVSSDLLETLRTGPHENYGYASVKTSSAEAEMHAGGFERDSEGNWLYRTGDRAGDPISLEIPAFAHFDRLITHADSFESAMTEFGINTSITGDPDILHRLGTGEFDIAMTYWGGRDPHNVFGGGIFECVGISGAIRLW